MDIIKKINHENYSLGEDEYLDSSETINTTRDIYSKKSSRNPDNPSARAVAEVINGPNGKTTLRVIGASIVCTTLLLIAGIVRGYSLSINSRHGSFSFSKA